MPADARYYDFWPGTWYRVIDGEIDTTNTRFHVTPGIHSAAFEETWRLVIDSTTTITARALRAWDAGAGHWQYVWISDDGLFQVWEGRRVNGDWYIYREFEGQGEPLLSRQAWLPQESGRVVRISEQSSDGGATWRRRFREEYRRVRE
jgi:hypothetical protein